MEMVNKRAITKWSRLKQKRERHTENDALGVVNAAMKVFLIKRGEEFNPYCGPGMINLLEELDKRHSVLDACKKLDLSYAKGWKLLKRFEEWLGAPAYYGHQGGPSGGSTDLSEESRAFMRRYRDFTNECIKAVESVAEKYWKS
jgi:molybdate transport system regulatory protein